MKEITITKNEAGQRFDKYLFKYFKEASSGFIYKMLRKKNITLNGKKSDGKEMAEEENAMKILSVKEQNNKKGNKCWVYILAFLFPVMIFVWLTIQLTNLQAIRLQ